MSFYRGIAFKLSVVFSACVLLTFALIFTFNARLSKRFLEKEVSQNAQNTTLATVYKTEAILRSVQKVPESLAYFLENSSYTKKELEATLQAVVENTPEICGATIAFEPYAFDPSAEYFAPYAYRAANKTILRYLGGEGYNYFLMDWYQIPKVMDRAGWSEPYCDDGGGEVLMATYSVPFYAEGNGRIRGIVTADISLDWLTDMVSEIKILDTGYGFLLSKAGTLITHPDKELIMNYTIFSLAEMRNDPAMKEAGRKMIEGKEGISPYTNVQGQQCLMYYAPVPATGWSLGILFPLNELMGDIVSLARKLGIIGVAGTFILVMVIILVSRSITKPLRAMARAADSIATGDLDSSIPPVKSKDEVGRLANSFRHMQGSLKKHIKDLTETTAAKQKIESELNVAREIQMSILPKTFPAFPEHAEVDVYAFMQAARQVGGDFYDYYFVDEDRMCFVIGDVSGKGVPASLFMAVTKTLLKATTTNMLTPDVIMHRVNNELSKDEKQNLFVTVFFGILNIRTGEIAFSNGGHNNPLIVRADGTVDFMEHVGGMVIGVMEGTDFNAGQIHLSPGDTIFLYTDGVTEAMDKNKEQFTDERLQESLEALAKHAPQEIIVAMMAKIKAFTGNCPQSDDITMMAIEYKGKKETKHA